jgi:integrase/DNA-binding CsgD family transcriptional regulator
VANQFKLTTDNRGRYRRQNLGKKLVEGNLTPATFFVGKDEREACRRVDLLEQMWEAVVNGWQEAGSPFWKPLTYDIALAVARGERDIYIPVPDWADSPNYQAGLLADLRSLFPFLNLSYQDGFAQGSAERVAERLQRDAQTLQDRARAIQGKATGTLHQALDAYHAFTTAKYSGKSSLRPKQRLVALLKATHDDLPLEKLTADTLDNWLALWNKRPTGKKGTLALTTCRNAQIALRAFFRWLARSEAFKWDMPRNYTFPRGRIDKLPTERVKRRLHFNRPELQIIWECARPLDRALILLALNCGFGPMEVATLRKEEIISGKTGRTFIKRHRTKTGVYGEWELWPETLDALAYLSQRPNDTAYVVVNERGSPVFEGTAGGNSNQTLKNHWDRLMARVTADHPDFYTLPFKCLRKTGATFVRKLTSGEVASMYLAHGERSDDKDQLLSVYTTRPWRKVHRALTTLREKLLPFLTVAEPWQEATKLQKAKPQVLALRQQGKTYEEIAAEVGLSPGTVGKLCREANGRTYRKAH